MALATTKELQSLVADLTSVSQAYSASPGPKGYMSRVQVIAKAKKLMQPFIMPDQLPNYHALNMHPILSSLPKSHQPDALS
jgi:hypothetical protein